MTNLEKLTKKQQKVSQALREGVSAMNSVAQSPTMYTPGNEECPSYRILQLRPGVHNDWDVINLAVLELQVDWGLRISEVIKIKPSDISVTGMIHIRGAKGSNDRYVVSRRYTAFWVNFVRKGNVIGDQRDRFYYYRLYKKNGIHYKKQGNVNNSVTHALRHQLIGVLEKEGYEQRNLSQLIGHKSKKSIIHYAKQGKDGS